MKIALAGIPALGAGVVAELYTITLKSGVVLYYTTADLDLSYGGHTYVCNDLTIERSPITTTVGINVDDVTVTLYPNSHSLGLPQFCLTGGFDGATVKIQRARNDRVIHLFEGLVSAAPQQDRTKVDLVVSAPTILLNIEMPRNVYASSCIYQLFDSGCGLSKAAAAITKTITAVSAANRLICVDSSAVGYYDLGTVTFLTGLNAGVSRSVNHSIVNNIYLSYPLDNAVNVGDTFKIYPGCDKLRTTCDTKFGNLGRYRGYPHIPTPEASI